MGCLKLSYYEREEGLEQSTVFFRGDQAKKGRQEKNREDYYPFGLTFNRYQRTGLDKNEYLYQGKEEMEGTDWYDFHARSYHAGLGRFMSVDPVYNGPSGFVGMNNNPISTIDPNGEEPITLASLAIAAAIGAGTSAVAYTASIALSDGGFNNWDWGQFGEGVAIGAFSGVMTFGIGEGFKTAAEVGKLTTTTADILKTATHATFQGGLSVAQGGDFLTAFASGAVGGAVGTQAAKLGNAATIGASMLMGGATAELSGGDFWKGATVAGIVAGANDVAHRIGMSREERARLQLKREIRRLQREIRKANNVQNGGKLLGESFQFEDVTGNWREASVTGLKLSYENPKKAGSYIAVDFSITVGSPVKLSDGTYIKITDLQKFAASSANYTAIGFGTGAALTEGKIYTSAEIKHLFAAAMQSNLNSALGDYLEIDNTGVRVTAGVSGNVTSHSAVWGPWTWQEKLKLIWDQMW